MAEQNANDLGVCYWCGKPRTIRVHPDPHQRYYKRLVYADRGNPTGTYALACWPCIEKNWELYLPGCCAWTPKSETRKPQAIDTWGT